MWLSAVGLPLGPPRDVAGGLGDVAGGLGDGRDVDALRAARARNSSSASLRHAVDVVTQHDTEQCQCCVQAAIIRSRRSSAAIVDN